jgi:hypothetical protein
MELFNMVFNKAQIYDMLFVNMKAVLEYPTLKAMVDDNKPDLFDRWLYISEKFDKEDTMEETEKNYLLKAPYYPEFCKIVAISVCMARNENNLIKRTFHTFSGNDELKNIVDFRNFILKVEKEAAEAETKYSHTLCGHNIVGYDIPLYIKRLILYRNKIEAKDGLIPKILKTYLTAKPWECNVVDTVNMWKFNGNEYSTLMLIADYLGLKRKENLITHDKLSQYYWDNIATEPQRTIDYITSQSVNQTNFVFQLINEMRFL